MAKDKYIVVCQPVLGGMVSLYKSVKQCCESNGLRVLTVRSYLNLHPGEWWTNGTVVVYRVYLNQDQNNRTGNVETLKPIRKGEKRRVRK